MSATPLPGDLLDALEDADTAAELAGEALGNAYNIAQKAGLAEPLQRRILNKWRATGHVRRDVKAIEEMAKQHHPQTTPATAGKRRAP
jgi:hypothetical protein